ncbi:hypothetical protein Vi05172_g6615 [Venturia inaequalis]|nr:hypothetical protein Vi05172_g6615 [Venturia inaequalis]
MPCRRCDQIDFGDVHDVEDCPYPRGTALLWRNAPADQIERMEDTYFGPATTTASAPSTAIPRPLVKPLVAVPKHFELTTAPSKPGAAKKEGLKPPTDNSNDMGTSGPLAAIAKNTALLEKIQLGKDDEILPELPAVIPRASTTSFSTRDDPEIAKALEDYWYREHPDVSCPASGMLSTTQINGSYMARQQDYHEYVRGNMPKQKDRKAAISTDEEEYHALRPDFSPQEPPQWVLTNHLAMGLPSNNPSIFQFNISGIPEGVTRKKKKALIETMINCTPWLKASRTNFVHDNDKTIYSWVNLLSAAPREKVNGDRGKKLYTITIENVPSARTGEDAVTGKKGANEFITMYLRVQLRLTDSAGIDLLPLKNEMYALSLHKTSQLQIILDAFNTIMAGAANADSRQKYTFQLGTNKFFLRSHRDEDKLSVEGHEDQSILQLHTGFFASVKAGFCDPLLNINTARSAFYQPLLFSQFLDRVWDSSNREICDAVRMQGLQVQVTYLSQPNDPRVKTVLALSKNYIGQVEFYKDGDKFPTKVVDHLFQAHQLNVTRGDLPAVNCGSHDKPEWYPAEFLKILPYQPFKGLLPTSLASSMVTKACKLPRENLAAIAGSGLAAFGITPGPGPTDILGSGLRVFGNLLSIPARTIPCPDRLYSGNMAAWFPKGNLGQWNLAKLVKDLKSERGYRYRGVLSFNTAATIPRLQYHVFGSKNGIDLLQRGGTSMAQILQDHMGSASKPQQIKRENVDPTVSELQAALKAGSHFVVWINSLEKEKGLYYKFRIATDRTVGVPSICITRSKLANASFPGFIANNAMKINSRLGTGVNHATTLQGFMPGKAKTFNTIILGADVTHPSSNATPGTGSIAALVGTKDRLARLYGGSARPNPPKQEMIDNLGSMVLERINAWRPTSNGNAWPSNVIYFRDGVSDAQYVQVRQHEVSQIYKVFEDAGQPRPNITAIIVGKRHHTRFYYNPGQSGAQLGKFPRGDIDGSGNFVPGLCVDSNVTHPYYFDFFLQSHQAIKGTARPAHYFVLQDEMSWDPTKLQNFVHSLCYTYAVSNTSVSYAPPAYYADRLCARVRNYFMDWMTGTEVVRGPEGEDPAVYGYREFVRQWSTDPRHTLGNSNPWHGNLDDKMFWL